MGVGLDLLLGRLVGIRFLFSFGCLGFITLLRLRNLSDGRKFFNLRRCDKDLEQFQELDHELFFVRLLEAAFRTQSFLELILEFFKAVELDEFLDPACGRNLFLVSQQNGFNDLKRVKHLMLVSSVENAFPGIIRFLERYDLVIEDRICRQNLEGFGDRLSQFLNMVQQ